MSKFKSGETAHPFHPRCRCITAPYDGENGDGIRFARDVKTDKGYEIPSDMTCEQRKKKQDEKYGEGTVDTERKKLYNKKADKEQLKQYRERLGKDAPKTLNEFQKLKYENPAAYKDLSAAYKRKGRAVDKSGESGIINTGSDKMLINKSSSASPLYISKHDDLYNNAKKVTPLEGYEDIVIHADKNSFYSYNMEGDEFRFSPVEMSNLIKQSKNYHGGKIRLIACETAAPGATSAQALADALGVEILAPSDIVWVDTNGNMTIGATSDANSGSWITVKPKKG